MPSKDNKVDHDKNVATQTQKGAKPPAPPAGYVKVQAERVQAYLKAQEGLVLHGILMGRYPRTDKPGRYYYQFCLIDPCQVQVRDPDDDDEWISEERPAGTLVNADESAAFRDLRAIVEKPGKYAVWLQFGAKEKIKTGPNAGNNFWPCNITASTTEYLGKLPGDKESDSK